jgi:hypothetical protein
MVYRLGRRVRPRIHRLRLLSLGLSSVAVGGMLAVAYASPLASTRVNHPALHQVYISTSSVKPVLPTKTNGSKSSVASTQAKKSSTASTAGLTSFSCSGLFASPVQGLIGAVSPELRKLAQYQQLCGGNLAGRSSFFVPTPTTPALAASDASDAAARLSEFASFGIKPLVFMEPATDAGTNIDLSLYAAGNYDTALNDYFGDLKTDGVTDSMMGMWVIVPEGNIPVWTSVDPSTYTTDVVKTIQFQKKYFPSSLSAIMLDGETYPSASSWSGGAYDSLLPYVQNIPKGLVDSFGLQGFPWSPPADQAGADLYDPAIYLPVSEAAQAASSLGLNNVWLNTGTFNQMYSQDSAETVNATPIQRQSMLNGVLNQAKVLQADGYSVAVHLFAQNKSNTTEGTDWSYWNTVPGDEPSTTVLATFVRETNQANIALWLFDTYDQ